jgi:hypothetical protein
VEARNMRPFYIQWHRLGVLRPPFRASAINFRARMIQFMAPAYAGM